VRAAKSAKRAGATPSQSVRGAATAVGARPGKPTRSSKSSVKASKPARSGAMDVPAGTREPSEAQTSPSAKPSKASEASQPARVGAIDAGAPQAESPPGELVIERAPDGADGAADEADRTQRIAAQAATREPQLVDGPVNLGSITVPSGTLALFDVGLMGYLPREALEPMLICAKVPADRALAVTATRVGKGRFADAWDHVAIALGAPGHHDVARSVKLGKAAVDFARLIAMDRAAIDHWRHEDSLDQLADFVFWGRDEAQLAKALGAKRLTPAEGYGWIDLPFAEAEALADRAAALKAENHWLLSTELRPHSHHFDILAAARASPSGTGVLEVGGARVLLFFTRWGDGVYPVFLDVDHDDQPIQLRIQLAPVEAPPAAAIIRTVEIQ
jgi:hypothetical protein